MNLIIDENVNGITLKSLQKLRNELGRRIDHLVEVHRIQTDKICCGYLIFDFTTREAIWTGDGFRTDEGGEGGSGERTAKILFHIYGIRLFEGEIEYIKEGCKEEYVKKLEKYIKETLEGYDEDKPGIHKPLSNNLPFYIRN